MKTYMIYIIIAGIILLIYFSVQYAKKVDSNPEHPYHNVSQKDFKIDSIEDNPVNFGYKNRWFAIKSHDSQKVAEWLKVRETKIANWKSGINLAYNNSIFVTPPINDWILVVGLGLPGGDSVESLSEIKTILKDLSREFGEAQYFSTHRVVEFHCWVKATNGDINRLYAYLGERGENIEISGEPTDFESAYNLVNTFSEKAQQNSYWDTDNLTIPDEELVMEIAGNWSINPTTLDTKENIKGLGLISKKFTAANMR